MKTKMIPLLALGIALAGCGAPVTSSSQSAAAPTVTTDVVKRQDLVGYSFFDGKMVIPASAQGTAFSPYDTSVVSVSTGLGKHVARGEPIVKLTMLGADEAAKMAKANVSSATSTYSDERATASAPVLEAQKALADARAAEKAARDTVAAGGTADVDGATQARSEAEATLQQAQLQMRQTLQPTKDAVYQSAAELRAAREDAQKGVVRAPISGTVVSMDAKAGLNAKSNQPLATIVNFDAVRVQGVVPPELKDKVARNSRVIVAMNGPSSDPLDGRVVDLTVLPPSAGQKSAGYVAVISLENPGSTVQPGTGVKRIGVKTGTAHNALVVPVGSIVTKGGKSFVSVQKGTDWVETPVETGITDGALVEIRSGLDEGSVVRVVSQPGDPIQH